MASARSDSKEEKSKPNIKQFLDAILTTQTKENLALEITALIKLINSNPALLDAPLENRMGRKETPLLYLCRIGLKLYSGGAFDAIEWLLKLGANVNATNEHGNTVLHQLLESQLDEFYLMLPLVNVFLRYGANITPELIEKAAKNNFDRVLNCFLNYDAERPFRIAVQTNNMAEVKKWLAKGFPCDNMPGWTNLIAFAREVKQPDMEKFFSDIAILFNIASGPSPKDYKKFDELLKIYLPDVLTYVTRADARKTLLDTVREAGVGDAATKEKIKSRILAAEKAIEYRVELKEIKEEKEPHLKFFGGKRKRDDADQDPRSSKKGFTNSKG